MFVLKTEHVCRGIDFYVYVMKAKQKWHQY